MSVLGHVAAGLVAGRASRRFSRLGRRGTALAIVGLVMVSILPDVDMIGEELGIAEHRGGTHSLAIAALVGAAAGAVAWRAHERAVWWALLVFAAMASHGVLDLFSPGPGIKLLWPFSDALFAAPWRPLPTPPMSAALLTEVGLRTLILEALVFAPVVIWALSGSGRRRYGDASPARDDEKLVSIAAERRKDGYDKPPV